MADRGDPPAGDGDGAADRLGAPASSRGPRRSPTTGHVRRRVHTPEPPRSPRSPRTRSEGRRDAEREAAEDAATTTEESEDGRPRPRDRVLPKRSLQRGKLPAAAKRSQSQPSPGEERDGPNGAQRLSTSEDDEDYWHAYFAIQSKNIAKHNGSSLAAAAAGVLRPAPARKKVDTTISRKSTAEKAQERSQSERRPSAPDFAVVRDGEPLPPTPKPTLRRRAPRSKSRGPPEEPPPATTPTSASAPASAFGESASETSSTTSRTSKADKSVIWKKWSQAPEPSRKEVLSIDPAEVLRGLVPDEALGAQEEAAPEQAEQAQPEARPEAHPAETPGSAPESRRESTGDQARLKAAPNGDRDPSSSRKSSERSAKQEKKASKQTAELVRKSSLRKERTRADGKAGPTPAADKAGDNKAGDKPAPAPADDKVPDKPPERRSWLARLFGRKPKAADPGAAKAEVVKAEVAKAAGPARAKVNWLAVVRDLRVEWRAFRRGHPAELLRMRALAGRCFASLLVMLLYCGLGGLLFRFIEGSFESFYKCGVKRVKRDFIDALWTSSHNLREDEWKSRARRRLWEFEEQLHAAHEAGVTSYSGIKAWSFLNAVVYCLTVVTTIGYGHISPSTNTGRAVTIIYAIFGIPMFLILLADFGKLFTRGIKFVWSFVRRLYYTGSCRQVRRTQPVQSALGYLCSEIMKGAQLVYDLATFRRPSMFPQGDPNGPNPEVDVEGADTPLQHGPQFTFRRDPADSSEPPGTPAPSAFEVDDEFNLPISVAIFILLLYLFVGASIYYIWESWGFFESFYFVFISMSTIGFGDFVPQHPMYMMASIVYLVFGLALTSMCINVVQEKLSDSFRQASAKIGATIGLRIAEQEEAAHAASSAANGQVEGEEGVDADYNDAKEVPS